MNLYVSDHALYEHISYFLCFAGTLNRLDPHETVQMEIIMGWEVMGGQYVKIFRQRSNYTVREYVKKLLVKKSRPSAAEIA